MLKLAWRTLWRQRTRTVIMIMAIAISTAFILFSFGTNDYMHERMMDGAVDAAGGHVLIHGAGYWEAQSGDHIIEAPEPILALLQDREGVRSVAPRVIINGLVSTSRKTSPVRLLGIDPAIEMALNDLTPYVTEGTLLGLLPKEVAADHPRLDETSIKAPLVLGRALVDELCLELGDKVKMQASTPSGEATAAKFELTGIVDTGSESLDKTISFTTIAAAQKAVMMEGSLTQIGLFIEADDARYRMRDELVSDLGVHGESLEVLTWNEAMPDMLGFVEIDDGFGYIFNVLIFLIVAFAIANTFMMSVMERTRELGLLSAMGVEPRRLALLIFYEASILAVISLFIGVSLGLVMHSTILHYGINLAELTGSDMEISGVVLRDMMLRSKLVVAKWALTTLLILFIVLVSALYPALKAMRLNPVEAMRTYD